MEITIDKRMCDVFSLPEFSQMDGQFIFSAKDWFAGGKSQNTFAQLNEEQITWSADDMVFGLRRLQKIASEHEKYVFQIENGNPARLIYMPSDEPKTDVYCLLMAGGAYGAVCSLAESIPVAARLNELGIDCFCLNYRVADENAMVYGLMPKPLDDVASAVKFIEKEWQRSKYIAGGFSAGGHVAALWGTENLGARHYDVPQPKALLLDYPLISLMNMPKGVIREYILQGLFGTGYNSSHTSEYSADLHVDNSYPPVYLAKAKDDTTVPGKDAADFEAALEKQKIAHVFEIGESGNHGYGLGTGTDMEGWAERAAEWLRNENIL